MTVQRRTIEVVPYDPHWVTLFEQEAARIEQAITEGLIQIHHIGSTSIPLLAAKPIIDIMLEVVDIRVLERFDQAMGALGYIVKGEFGVPGRRFYIKGLMDRTHHVHAFESGSEGLARHLAFREYLREHSEEALEYAQLKIKLADKFRYDNTGYCDGKNEFVQLLEQRALNWKKRKQEASPDG